MAKSATRPHPQSQTNDPSFATGTEATEATEGTETTEETQVAQAAEPARRPPLRDAKSRFLKGEGGRETGSRSRLAKAFLTDLYNHWLQHGAEVTAKVRKGKPDAFLRAVISVLPAHFPVEDENALDKLTDEELRSLIDEVRQVLALAGRGEEPEGQTAR